MVNTAAHRDGRDQILFASTDSAPKKFAGLISVWRAPTSIVVFTITATVLLILVNSDVGRQFFPNRDLVFSPYDGNHAIAIRIFLVSFYFAFALFSSGSMIGRIGFATDLVVRDLVICTLLDLANIIFHTLLGVSYALHFSAITSGLIGFALFSFKLLQRGFMPARIRVEHLPLKRTCATIRLFIIVSTSAVTAFWVSSMDFELVHQMRSWTLLGGIGLGVFLSLPVLFGQLYALSIWDFLKSRTRAFKPAISVIVPAYNEQYIIADTILAIDEAAAHYGADVHILIMDNNSSDATEETARLALEACTAAQGRIIKVPRPGKANALNAGLDTVETEFFVRVDADTLIGRDNLTRAMRYFADPQVGIVGGVPVPPRGALFDRARLLEVLVKHGFYSVALGAINGVVGIPGMFVVMRTEHPRYLGGFVEGMNGEDTDLSLRIGELGYHSVVDPTLLYTSEVPATHGHMREQRMRWFRSVFHVSSRCRDLIYSKNSSLRGKVILPYMLVNSARRAMLVPLIVFGSLECVFSFNELSPIVWQSVVAVTTGTPSMVAVAATLMNGVPRALVAVPDYLIFRVLRAYFTLESLLSIFVDTRAEDLEEATIRDLQRSGSIRIA